MKIVKRIFIIIFVCTVFAIGCSKNQDGIKNDTTIANSSIEETQSDEAKKSSNIYITDVAIVTALQERLGKGDNEFTNEELSGITELSVECLDNTVLSELELLPNLDFLDVSGCSKSMLEGFANVSSLKYLYIDNMELQSLAELPMLQSLVVLSLKDTGITSLEGINNMTSLEELFISGSVISNANVYADKINALKNCNIEIVEEIEEVQVSFVDAALEQDLRSAILNFTNPITQEELDAISSLMLMNSEICALDDLKQCKNLKTLVLWNTQVNNFMPVLEMEALEEIYVYTEQELDYSILINVDSIKKVCVNDKWLKGSEN